MSKPEAQKFISSLMNSGVHSQIVKYTCYECKKKDLF